MKVKIEIAMPMFFEFEVEAQTVTEAALKALLAEKWEPKGTAERAANETLGQYVAANAVVNRVFVDGEVVDGEEELVAFIFDREANQQSAEEETEEPKVVEIKAGRFRA